MGEPGRNIIRSVLPGLAEKKGIDFVVANGENAAGGSGITPRVADQLFDMNVDVITTGDHVWDKKEVYDYLAVSKRLLRPANYPDGVPGAGFTVIESKKGKKVGVINILGRVFINPDTNCPFASAKAAIEKISKETKMIVVDFHAEATSEKVAMGWYLDGMVSAVVGSHTHIQTADEKILPKGTAYLTDCGMTGPYFSVIGRKQENVIERFLTQLPARFEMAEDDPQMHGAIVEVDESTGRALSIERV